MDPIQQNQYQQAPQQPITPPMETVAPVEHKKVGPIITITAVVLILIIGALYLFASQMGGTVPDSTTNNSATAAQEVKPVTNTSDNIDDIQADLDTSVKGLDSQNF